MPPHPLAIFVQLTTACNAECVACPHPFTYGRLGTHQKGPMPRPIWDTLVAQVRRAGYKGQIGLYLHHEPLLVKSLYQKIRHVNETTEAFVVLSTNGALLTPHNRSQIIAARPRQIHININSADPVQYNTLMKGLDFDQTFENARRFIEEAAGRLAIEINCPVLDGVDTEKLKAAFPSAQVNVEYWANSRGGLLGQVSAAGKGSRFKLAECCRQPTVNFNVLWNGGVIACCMDWAHETKDDFPSILERDLFEIYNGAVMRQLQADFETGDYSRYRMCSACALEMGFPIIKAQPQPLDGLVQIGAC